ncbi:hypothetical protein R6Q57_018366 [Mikania cordata]
MDPRAPFSFTHLLNKDDDVQQNPPQQPSFPQFSQTQQFSQYLQLQPFPQFHQQGPSFPQFSQFPPMPQFSQPQPAFDAQQWQQFLQCSGAYTSSASDANFGENPEIAISLVDIDKEDFEIQLQQVTTTRPIGRDKAKAKAMLKDKAGIEPSKYDLRKLMLIDEISSTNRAKCDAIEKFEHRIDKFYEIEKKKL